MQRFLNHPYFPLVATVVTLSTIIGLSYLSNREQERQAHLWQQNRMQLVVRWERQHRAEDQVRTAARVTDFILSTERPTVFHDYAIERTLKDAE